jgi:hypothetical protein
MTVSAKAPIWRLARVRCATAWMFFANGAALGSWVPHIPDARQVLGLSQRRGQGRGHAACTWHRRCVDRRRSRFLAGPPVIGLVGERLGLAIGLGVVAVALAIVAFVAAYTSSERSEKPWMVSSRGWK